MIEQRNVGKSGLRVSAIGLGCNNFGRSLDLAASRPVIHTALDLGITFFDCADVYGRRGGAETILAQVLGPRRMDIILTTKFGRRMDDAGRLMGGSRRYIFTATLPRRSRGHGTAHLCPPHNGLLDDSARKAENPA